MWFMDHFSLISSNFAITTIVRVARNKHMCAFEKIET
uniref:Uncharacterized protein n=1 Tax=Rhizophora mucronata TaxID=61149 RepID=A0A2P2NMI1_RHIMU